MSGYYPHATSVQGSTNPRPVLGDRATWSQHFKNAGYYSARVSKIYHMGVPGGIEEGSDGADDGASWAERFNRNITLSLDNPAHEIRDTAVSVAGTSKGHLLSDDHWAYIQYGEDAKGGIELFDMKKDPKQFTNLANSPDHASVVKSFKVKLAEKLAAVRQNDLGGSYRK